MDAIEEYINELMEKSTPDCPAWNIESLLQGKKSGWNYIDGCMIKALLEMYDVTGDKRYLEFSDGYLDHRVKEDGTIDGYDVNELNIDNINAGKTLFELYDLTGKEKYRKAIDLIYSQVEKMPRTKEGNFWHKNIYPNQVWLDGLYMCQPFYMEYETRFGYKEYYDDIYNQFFQVVEHMRDAGTGLYYHAYDSSREMFWCDKKTGLSQNFWLRALGWYSMALLDTLDKADSSYAEPYEKMKIIFLDLIDSLLKYQDESGMWYQVVNLGGMDRNYLETSGSAILSYAILKGVRLGFLPKSYRQYGERAFNGICDRYLDVEKGNMSLGGICLVAGLGGKEKRSGTYDYYMSEPVVKDDAKGVGPFLLAYTEMRRLKDKKPDSVMTELTEILRLYEETRGEGHRSRALSLMGQITEEEDWQAVGTLLDNQEKTLDFMPLFMKYETAYKKKEHYKELVEMFRKKEKLSDKDLISLRLTIDQMSEEIYEYYRELKDLLKSAVGSDLKLVWKTARAVALELSDGQIFEYETPGQIFVNGQFYGMTNRVVFGIFDLKPESCYDVRLKWDQKEANISFCTEREFVTLDVKEMGARGDGIQDDTPFIQAAIMACPRESRVLIPQGTYRVTSIFLRSHIRLELSKGAKLQADTDRWKYPRFPGMIESYDGTDDYNLGTWEGNPLPMFAGIITGIEVEDVEIYGEGVVDGQASSNNWWADVRVMKGAFRPRMVFLERCKDVTIQGISFKNSPTWVLHPYFSRNLRFIGLDIKNPADSPNTDGLDPESCKDVEIVGLHFSLGDDCIAIKSGKIYMGRRYKTPSENITIRQCLMENGHGAITVGSEVGAGVKAVYVKDCLFRHTDRGLRIKTRRGRGKDCVLSDIHFDHIHMDHVRTPFVVNSFYFCDPDGKSDYVQDRNPRPVDDRTPMIESLYFSDIRAKNCHVAASFLCGLPEQKIGHVEFKNVDISFAAQAEPGVPAMLDGVGECSKKGFIISDVDTLICDGVCIAGQEGEAFELSGVNHYEDFRLRTPETPEM